MDEPVNPSIRSSYTTSLSAYQCLSCSHVQADCPLVPYYKDVITSAALSPTIIEARDSRIQWISELLNKDNPKICEIGAYKGHYLEHLKALGYSHVHGIENSQVSTSQPNESSIHLQQGYLLDDDLAIAPENCFDIILCFNFLEHIPSPFQFLQVIKSRLAAPSSYLYFTMPSYDYIKSHNLLQEFVPDHLSYFTGQSLKVLFQRSNLNIISLKEINSSNDLEIIAHHQDIHVAPLDPSCLIELTVSLDSILFNASNLNHTVAFWGAGHRSLTLISQLHHQHISFIVDSADFKQGKYCPDTGLMIVSPAKYYSAPTDILILSLPGIYVNEVLVQLEQLDRAPQKIYNIKGNTLSVTK